MNAIQIMAGVIGILIGFAIFLGWRLVVMERDNLALRSELTLRRVEAVAAKDIAEKCVARYHACLEGLGWLEEIAKKETSLIPENTQLKASPSVIRKAIELVRAYMHSPEKDGLKPWDNDSWKK